MIRLLKNPIFRQMVIRSIRTDYLENVTGFAWLVIQPLLLLAVYAFVFTQIFKARIPDSLEFGFVPYLAVAFWPWMAFSESVLRASSSISANAALIGKVAFPVEMLPLSIVTATFGMHMVGYLAVLLVLQFTGTDIYWLGVICAVPLLLLLFLFSAGLALVCSTLQVFVRDVAQILPPLFTFWFFMTPILYGASFLPDNLARWLQLNPLTAFMERVRSLILLGEIGPQAGDGVILLVALIAFLFGWFLFRRFSPHFEDFL